MWTIMLAAVLILIVYIILVVSVSDDLSKYHPVVQFVCMTTISLIYLFAAFIYFVLKYPTLF